MLPSIVIIIINIIIIIIIIIILRWDITCSTVFNNNIITCNAVL